MDLPTQDRKNGHVPIVASNGVVGYHNVAPVKGPGVIIGRSGSIGGGQYVTEDFWPLNTTLWVKDFKGNNPRFCYYLLRSHGSVFDTITTETMKGVFVIYPDIVVVQAFETLLQPVMDRLQKNLEQAQTLATLRDTLLPRLISGQLRLPDAEALSTQVFND
jgi:type I restriction enzyme S subunit